MEDVAACQSARPPDIAVSNHDRANSEELSAISFACGSRDYITLGMIIDNVSRFDQLKVRELPPTSWQ
jgi:hypothetical protein